MMKYDFSGINIVVLGAHTGALQFFLDRFPSPGDYLVARRFSEAIDGAKGSNQSIAAARLGADVTILTALGNDKRGKYALDYMKKENIDTSHVLISKTQPTGFGAGFYLEDGTPMGATFLGAGSEITEDYIYSKHDIIERTDILLVSMEIPVSAALLAIGIARKGGVRLIQVNPSPADGLKLDDMAHIDVLTPNESEARYLAGIESSVDDDIPIVAGKLVSKGAVPLLAITLGKRGCYLKGENIDEVNIPCPVVNAVDTSGAGDCFNSSFALALINDFHPYEAAEFAVKCASYSVKKPGSWPAYPTLAQLGLSS